MHCIDVWLCIVIDGRRRPFLSIECAVYCKVEVNLTHNCVMLEARHMIVVPPPELSDDFHLCYVYTIINQIMWNVN